MPADTPTKRYSAVNIGSPWRGILPFPDGVMTQGDRQTVMFLYAGILDPNNVLPRGALAGTFTLSDVLTGTFTLLQE